MSGVYGEVLTAFPEQWMDALYFDMNPEMGSGFGPRMNVTMIQIIDQNYIGSVIEKNGFNLVAKDNNWVWSDIELQPGRFLDIDGKVYRLTKHNNWNREAGFWAHEVEKVVGDNGANTEDSPINSGANLFS